MAEQLVKSTNDIIEDQELDARRPEFDLRLLNESQHFTRVTNRHDSLS